MMNKHNASVCTGENYMKSIQTLLMTGILMGLTGCGTDSTSGTSAKISETFNDTAVTNFSQTSGIAKSNLQKATEFIIASAYAGTGTISCLSGESVSFQMDALGNTVNIDATCNSFIDRSIRRGLLKSMDGISIKRTISDASYKNGALDFTAGGSNGGFAFNTNYKVVGMWKDAVVDGGNNDGIVDSNELCYERYTFASNGTVSIAPHADNVTQNTNNGSLNCATGLAYNDSASFRFKDGALELDLTYTNNFDPAHVFPAGHSDAGSSSYEKWVQCTVGVDCKI